MKKILFRPMQVIADFVISEMKSALTHKDYKYFDSLMSVGGTLLYWATTFNFDLN